MIKFIFRLFVIFIIILILFAILPDKFWQWLKPYFNWEIFINTLNKGWQKFWQFIQEITGINFLDFFDKIKNYTGLDIVNIYKSFKYFLSNIFYKISDWLK
ncbi:MAG: hypothetical protein KatS3mg095_0049 [Candidatus Parcubacteria bacterium]|nr:MAG: hypothetical protein KatS3mg095_0049 [Candidatus Parcubacteria bacterium]